MTSKSDEPQRPANAVPFADYDAGMDALERCISLLRAWAVSPDIFTSISPADRQNLFLTTLESAEAARTRLSSLK